MNRAVWAVVSSAVVLGSCLAPSAMASSLSQKKHELSQLQSKSDQTSATLSQQQKKASALKHSIATKQTKIDQISNQISSDQSQLRSLSRKLQQLDQQVHKTQQQLAKDNADLQQMLVANYEDGSVPYVDVLFHATNWADLLSRAATISMVAQHEQDLLNQVKQLSTQLQAEKASQTKSYHTLQAKSAQLQTLVATYSAQQKEQTISLAALNDQIRLTSRSQSLLESQIHLTQSEIAQIEAATAAADQKMQSSSYISQATASLKSANVDALISYAKRFEGTPYVFGGTSPGGFDCSGYVQYVFSHFGIDLPRTTWGQYGGGLPVSRGDLQPGDLLFFSTYSPGASHVGIYIGGGDMIDAENAGVIVTGVFNNSYWAPRYIGARDYIRH